MRFVEPRGLTALLSVLLLLGAACGRSAEEEPSPTAAPGVELATTTPPGTEPVDSITWGVYRETNSLDPIYAFDYPENTVLAVLCETLLRQAPDGSIGPGLAELSYPDDTTMVFTLKDGVTFWNGDPLTPDDVVYSLERNTDPDLGGFYGAVFTRVDSIEATGDNEVTITLNEPDYWLAGELASTPGWIVQRSYVEEKGADFGSPAGGTMCTGSYELGEWRPGEVLSVVRNDDHWDASVEPLVRQIDFVGASDDAGLTSSLLTGGIDGYYAFALSTLDQLRESDAVTVTDGAGWNTDAFIISNFDGPLGDVRVRQALSLALDRQGLVDTIYKGAATIPKALSPPGTWGYGRDVFAAAYAELPDMEQDIEAAKVLVADAGIEGQTITFGMSSELANTALQAAAYQAAAEAIGLDAELKSVSAANYINFFIDAEFRKGVDGWFTVNYGDFADPTALLATLVMADGSQNYSGYENPEVTRLMNEARSTADLDERAQIVADAQAIIMEDMPWIPTTFPSSVLITNSNLSGAVASFAYMFARWANDLGGVG